jgi:hypothetical protein
MRSQVFALFLIGQGTRDSSKRVVNAAIHGSIIFSPETVFFIPDIIRGGL